MLPPVLTTKLHMPALRPKLVSRPRLTWRIDEGLRLGHRLILIAAPAGFGKTTVVSEWRTSGLGQPWPLAWISLDEGDNDPVHFWRYVIAALETIQPGVGSGAQAFLEAPQPPPIEHTLAALINALAQLPRHLVLVLDDYHAIEAEPIHQALSFLIDHLPPQLHLIITSRTVPLLSLNRIRVRNQLTELRQYDLRFSPSETTTFLNQTMGLTLSPEVVAALETRTEGWVAGLQLAALSIQDRGDVHGFVRAFTGSHRYVIDYLAEEVLATRPEPVRRFLLWTSILTRLSGPLCDAVTNSEDGQLTLETLEATNLFLIPLDNDRRWYRYHHLFADFLRTTLQKTVSAEERLTLHRRASRWYLDHGFTEEAVSHLLVAGNLTEAADLIEQVVIGLLTRGEAITLLGWLDALPTDLVRSRPRLALAQVWAMVILDRWSEAEALLPPAEQSLTELTARTARLDQDYSEIERMWSEVAAIRAMQAYEDQADMARAIELSHQALATLAEDNLVIRSVLATNLGTAYVTAGESDKAPPFLQEAIRTGQASGNLIITLYAAGTLAQIELEKGHLRQAMTILRQSVELIEDWATHQGQPGQSFPVAGLTYLNVADLYREWNDLDAAHTYSQIALELSRQLNIRDTFELTLLIQARIFQARGEPRLAQETIHQAMQRIDASSPHWHWIAAMQARLWLSQGDLTAAIRWAETTTLALDDQANYGNLPGEYMSLARVFIAQGDFDKANQLLTQLHSSFEADGRTGRLLEVRLLEALAAYHQSNIDQALTTLSIVLMLAEPENYTRLFIDEGPPIAKLLKLAQAQAIAPHYVAKLLGAFQVDPHLNHRSATLAPALASPTASLPNLLDPLSERELEILQFVAQGLTNQAIADQLVIAVSTVKSHTNKIFAKLDVQNRTQAVARARELKLI